MMRHKLAFAMSGRMTKHVFDADSLARLTKSVEIVRVDPLETFDTPEAREVLKDITILITGWGSPRLTPETVATARKLKLVAHAAGTVKGLVHQSVYDSGIRVTHAAEANSAPVAEFTIASIIFAGKRIFAFRDLYRADVSRKSSVMVMDSEIGNFRRVVGIIGASRIGRRVIKLLRQMDYSILLYDPIASTHDPDLEGVEFVNLNDLMSRSDVVSLHAPSLPSTRGMIGREQFALMKGGATFINTARGALVDQDALIEELQTGRLDAIIDVTDPEIPEHDSPLFTLPNVFLTPHIAGAIGTERARLGIMTIDEIERFVRGRPLQFEITATLLESMA